MTRTSATGTERRLRAGFTLVELLVVVVILGLAGAAVVLTLPDPRPSVAAEAERFAAVLTRAREEAVLTNRAFEVRIDAEGYAFRTRDWAEWRPVAERPFDPRRWEEATTVTVRTAGAGEAVQGAVVFDPTGVTEAATVVLRRDRSGARVAVTPSGEVSVDAAR
jgi:general secretion pathway protein H